MVLLSGDKMSGSGYLALVLVACVILSVPLFVLFVACMVKTFQKAGKLTVFLSRRIGVKKVLRSMLFAVVAFVLGSVCVSKIDQAQSWFSERHEGFTAWWNGPPADASPLCLQLARMMQDSQKWDLNGDDYIMVKQDKRIKYNVQVINGKFLVLESGDDDIDSLLTDSERKWLAKKYDECRKQIVDRYRLNMANKLKGSRSVLLAQD